MTEANHADNEFYELGDVRAEVPARDLFDWLPTERPHDCSAGAVCFMVDLNEGGGEWPSLVDSREVSTDAAMKLLGGAEAFKAARWRARVALAQEYARAAS